jgi:hypothetical protein
MATDPQFILTFRGVEVGRYETPERATAAARSVIDTELGSRPAGSGDEHGELPRIEWQPPRVAFPFDAAGYWHHRVQMRKRDAEAARHPAPQPTTTDHGPRRSDSLPRPTPTHAAPPQGVSGDAPMLPRRQDAYQPAPPPTPVHSGPPQRGPAPRPPAPVYGGPPPSVRPAPPPTAPTAPPEPKEEEPRGKRRWFGKNRDESQ